MANLNEWQKLTRVSMGLPFGNGADGTYSSATCPTMTRDSFSGTINQYTMVTSGATFSNGDILLLHQSRGTGAGQWEINRIVSGGGTPNLTLQAQLKYTYTDDGGNSQAQATKIPQYVNATVSAGTWSIPTWNGNTGGILVIAVKGTLTITGTISASSLGYLPGLGDIGSTGVQSGEGTQGPVLVWPNAPTHTGGSGGGKGYGGGGGGNGGAGGNGTGSYEPGIGGDSVGSTDLVTILFGGGGGSGASANEYDGDGGYGGGIVIIFAKTIATITGAINSIGSAGETSPPVPHGTGGGGGAGGSVLIVCQTATLGTNKITATGGAAGGGANADDYGGAGGTGRIAVHYSGSVTGSTNPTMEDVSDGTLVEASYSGVLEG
jgi:hypothetical protein